MGFQESALGSRWGERRGGAVQMPDASCLPDLNPGLAQRQRRTLLALRMAPGQKKQDTVDYALKLYHVAPIPKHHLIHLTALDPNS